MLHKLSVFSTDPPTDRGRCKEKLSQNFEEIVQFFNSVMLLTDHTETKLKLDHSLTHSLTDSLIHWTNLWGCKRI